MTGAPELKRMRKPRFCDSCRSKEWPAFGVGCPCFRSERPPELRDVYLWHCGATECEADCHSRYADQLRKLGRFDLAAKQMGGRLLPRAPDPAVAGQTSLFEGQKAFSKEAGHA